MLWLTQSKAFCKLQKMPPTIILLLSASKIPSSNLYEALFVEEEVLKPNCSSVKILLVSMCCKSLSYMILSKTLENAGSKEIGL